jgi:hypothetical protein
VAIRFDVGYDRAVVQGGGASDATGFITFGLGVPFESRLSHNVSFVSGRVGAMNFAHFLTAAPAGGSIYFGAGEFSFASADLFTLTKAFDGSSLISVNLPAGLLVQVADPLAITLRTGYQALIATEGGFTEHFVPLGFDAVLSPSRDLDLGVSFLLPGYVGGTGNIFGNYTDTRIVSFWLRLRT